jgi:hypothetical protein
LNHQFAALIADGGWTLDYAHDDHRGVFERISGHEVRFYYQASRDGVGGQVGLINEPQWYRDRFRPPANFPALEDILDRLGLKFEKSTDEFVVAAIYLDRVKQYLRSPIELLRIYNADRERQLGSRIFLPEVLFEDGVGFHRPTLGRQIRNYFEFLAHRTLKS